MKKQLVILVILFLFVLVFTSCNIDLHNKFTFNNYSQEKVSINFRGDIYPVKSGDTFSITDIPKGTYTYATTYELPLGATSSTTVGDVTGSVVFGATTNILIVYSSTFNDTAYTLYATISSSDDQAATSP